MHTTIIAEAGVNHNGSMTLAKQMVERNDWSGRVAASDVTEAGTDTGGFYRTTGVL